MTQTPYPKHIRVRLWKRQLRLQELGYKDYDSYIASAHWESVKQRFWEANSQRRCICGDQPRIIHHKTYERLGEEKLSDLIGLCEPCHRLLHHLDIQGWGLRVKGLVSQTRAKRYAAADRTQPTPNGHHEGWGRGQWVRYRLENKKQKR